MRYRSVGCPRIAHLIAGSTGGRRLIREPLSRSVPFWRSNGEYFSYINFETRSAIFDYGHAKRLAANSGTVRSVDRG
jgi:hypothetical protein